MFSKGLINGDKFTLSYLKPEPHLKKYLPSRSSLPRNIIITGVQV